MNIKKTKVDKCEYKDLLEVCINNGLEYSLFDNIVIEKDIELKGLTIDSCIFQNINFAYLYLIILI